MILNRLEVLADAIAYNNRAHEPESPAYQNRNPGNLLAFSFKHAKDEAGHRIFLSFLDGYQALLFDLRVKCGGRSRSKLPDSPTLNDLMKAYGHEGALAGRYVAKRIKKALGIDVTEHTLLSFFLEP
jgi:hypothetical protein